MPLKDPLRSCKDSRGLFLWHHWRSTVLPKLQGNFSFSKTFFCFKKQLNVEQLLITPIIEAFLPNIFRLSCWFRLKIWNQVKETIFDQGPKLFLGLNAKLKIRILNWLQRMHSTPRLRLARLGWPGKDPCILRHTCTIRCRRSRVLSSLVVSSHHHRNRFFYRESFFHLPVPALALLP